MRSLRNLVLGGIAIGASLALVAPVQSATYYTYSAGPAFTFNLGGNNSSNPVGNPLSFTGKTIGGATMTVSASAWNATKVGSTYSFTKAGLEQWSGGLGVTSSVGDNPQRSGCDLGDCNSHEIDNLGNNANTSSIDFVRLDFSDYVVLGGIGQTVYPSLNPAQTAYAYDADFSIGRGLYSDAARKILTTATDVNTGLSGVTNLSTSLFTRSLNVTSCTASNYNSCSQTQTIYTPTQAAYQTASKTWYVAASVLGSYGGDSKTDGFKLASLNAYYITKTPHQSAVPEPSTWMTMIVGFGTAGTALRRARRQKAALAA